MVEPLIQNPQNNDNFSNKANFVMAEGFAKLLWKKQFQKSAIQEHDDQIVSVVKEVYKAPESREKQVGDWILDVDMNYLVHAAYKHIKDNIVLVCYRGTDFKDVKDVFSDVQIVLWVNWIDERVERSISFFDEVQMKYPDSRKWICGHSLGGTISYIVTKHRNPERCIVFNSWSSPTTTFLWMMMDTLLKKKWTKSVTTYKIWWDVVSTFSFVWNVKNFVVKSVNPLTLHTIDTFPELFQKEKIGD